ncbi:hypothetical protein [Microbacterium binotii]|uniref:hypothetical protein n=1 Tax=Microbacterium binotii TaxID=462710 RepID=UPI001F23BEA8|nr:hypothetical protein [Microbacterium binotii]UIN30925.1 hypothetical protein LXM64_01580 [Microbacterium binotii]
MEDDQWQKIVDARHEGWSALRNRQDDSWPAWVAKLDVEVRTWLSGESVDYAVFDYAGGDDDWAENALEATSLTATILSTRFVARATLTKPENSPSASRSRLDVVARSAITSLRMALQSPQPQFGPAFVTLVEFEGLSGVLQIPADAMEWYTVSASDRTRIFASLRDDLLLKRD